MVTLSDVAKVAGVSAKTVSRAINGDREISAATRERILDIADDLEYVPHAQARRLASGKTRSIALHYPLSNPQLFSERLEMSFVSGIAMGAAFEDYYFTLFTGELSPGELRRICKSSIADGLILMQVGLEDWRVDTLRALEYPFAMIGRCGDNTGLDFIDFDFETALVDAFDFLVALGHSRIAFLTYPVSWRAGSLGPAIRARLGFEAAIAEARTRADLRRMRPERQLERRIRDAPARRASGHLRRRRDAPHDGGRRDQCHPGRGADRAGRLLGDRYRLRD